MNLKSLLLSLPVVALGATLANSDSLELYIDADYSINVAAAESIQLGVETALSEVENDLGGFDVRVVPMDHRGNVKRSHLNMKRYLQSNQALALIGGLHSPPYLSHKDFMNENQVLTLLPWSAAGPITRANPGFENWIFRLSVDDFQSGDYLIREAVDRGGCEHVAFLLLDTGWGRANRTTLTNALEVRGRTAASVQLFPTSLGAGSAQTIAQNVVESSADCVILLANWHNGATMVNALHNQERQVRVFSHWGITGGRFADEVAPQVRNDLDIKVLQTCALRRESEGSAVLSRALKTANPAFNSVVELPAITGFVHGYDLTRLLIAAAKQAATNSDWQSGDITTKRALLRSALLDLNDPVQGILATYSAPFEPFGPNAPDGHEALGIGDLCMARFDESGLLEDAS